MGGGWSRQGNTVYGWIRFWPGRELGIGGFHGRLKSARLLATGEKIKFVQERHRILLQNLPVGSPDKLCGVTVIVLEFAGPPRHKSFADTPAMAVFNKKRAAKKRQQRVKPKAI
jgi:hypothetical protein